MPLKCADANRITEVEMIVIVRAMFLYAFLLLLVSCGGGGGITTNTQPTINPSASYVEVVAAPRKVALVATANQVIQNGDHLTRLAASMTADLNSRAGQFGPTWSVSVINAANTVQAIRNQLKGFNGAIFIGMVPVAINNDGQANTVYLDPYRVPDCELFQFDQSGNFLTARPNFVRNNPRCRNGLVVSILRGRSLQNDIADVAAKLDQMIAYHQSSATANLSWTKSYQFVQAGWFNGLQWPDMVTYWSDLALYSRNQLNYVMPRSSAEAKAAFLNCVSNSNEMCIFNGHGSPSFIQFEGPDSPANFYSSDFKVLYASELAAQNIKAKYISLVSCSTQDFLQDDSFGTTLLMSGKALLTHGMVTVSAISSLYEDEQVHKRYPSLLYGGTFADAYFGDMEDTPMNFQGDPYITLRPVPGGNQPKLVIDGKHYNGGNMVMGVTLPDSVGGSTSTKTMTFSNGGNVDLHLKFTLGPLAAGVGYDSTSGGTPPIGGGTGLILVSPFPLPAGGAATDLSNVIVTVKPSENLAVTYGIGPLYLTSGARYLGTYTGRFEILSDDPAMSHLFLEMTGVVR
jgi:hypothetical protein